MNTPSESPEATPATGVSEESRVGTPLMDVKSDRRLQRLQLLVDRSKIYANILTERLATSAANSPLASPPVPPSPADTPPKRLAEPVEETPVKKRRGRKVKQTKQSGQQSILSFVKKSTDGAAVDAEKESSRMVPSQTGTGQPSLVVGGTLHPYQLAGVQWLVSLFENGLNGILADEMGLGKTLQVISFLAYLIEHGISGPFLIVAPLSTIQNWINEFNRFCPDVGVLKYHGTPDEREALRSKMTNSRTGQGLPVIVTSYEMITRDAKHLGKYQWKYIIVDEGHRLKNMNCLLIKQLKKFDSANRLLLTGTPLQNNLAELWSLLNFLLPDIFSDLEQFQAWFETPGADSEEEFGHEVNESLISSLHEILRPFLLRRVKSDIALCLPSKREYVLYSQLTDDQTALYQSILDRKVRDYVVEKIIDARSRSGKVVRKTRKPKKAPKVETPSRDQRRTRVISYAEEEDDAEFIRNVTGDVEEADRELDLTSLMVKQADRELANKSFLNLVMQLRLACNAPYLFYYPWSEGERADSSLIQSSGKMILLDKLANRLVKGGHRFLIFSQFTKMLDLLEDWVADIKGWKYCRIDGSTNQDLRQEQMDKFNRDEDYKVFLLSTRAGGLGINLTGADTVILYDSDWNPQQDLQAMDRVHRLGQKKPVIIYRLATANTVEQHLLQKADAKRRLEQIVIEKGKFRGFGFEGTTVAETLERMGEQLRTRHKGVTPGEITDNDMNMIMDRSQAAYERARDGRERLSEGIVLVDTLIV